MQYKRKIIVLTIAIVIYFILSYIYSHFILKNEEVEAVIFSHDITKGTCIEEKDIQFIKIQEKNINNTLWQIDKNKIIGKYATCDYYQGQIIYKDMLIEKEEAQLIQDGKERISLKIKNVEESISNQLQKDSLVAIYYTAKTSLIKDMIQTDNVGNVSNRQVDGYTTIKLIEKIKILDVYDKNGIKVDKNGKNIQMIDSITIEADEKLVMRIQHLKEYGEFHFSMVR